MQNNLTYHYKAAFIEGCAERYKFGFNGQNKDDEIYGEGNTYSAQYWEYDARLGRRWNLDPVDQISISNYACFGDNPILIVDPFGDTGFQLNKVTGEITELKAEDGRNDGGNEYDVLYASNEDGSINLDNNTIVNKNVLSNPVLSSRIKTKEGMTTYFLNGDENGTTFFEFVADNSDVEWSQIKTGNNEKGKNIVGTTHNKAYEVAGSQSYFSVPVFLPRRNVREHIHSHPSGNPYPSGSYTDRSKIGDMNFASKLNRVLGYNITFKIYVPNKDYVDPNVPSGTYWGYDYSGSLGRTYDELEAAIIYGK